MSDLPKRLRIKASMIALGERIAWGSDTALMEEAADEVERLREKLAETKEQSETRWAGYVSESNLRREIEAERDALRAECERLRDDLEVMAADRDGCARQRDQLRAELWTGAWTLPPEAPDVSGLVEALKEARMFTLEHDSGRSGYVRGRIDAALAAHKAGGVK